MPAMLWPGSKSSSGATAAGTTTFYTPACTWILGDTTETFNYLTARTAGVWSGLYARVPTNGVSATSTFRSRVNTANGAQTFTVGAGATGEFRDAVNTDTIAAGDEIAVSTAIGAGGTSLWDSLGFSVFTPTNAAETTLVYATKFGPNQTLNGVTRYYSLTGFRGPNGGNTVEANQQYSVRAAFTFRNLFVVVRSNAKGGNSFQRLRVNGANGNLVITIGAGVTGILEDTSNTDVVADGDEVCFSVDFFADANGLRFYTTAVEAMSANRQAGLLFADGGEYAGMTGTTKYESFGPSGSGTTEADVAGEVLLAGTFSRASVYVSANTTAAQSDIQFRINGGDGTILIAVGSGATGQMEDVTHTDTVAATDEVDWEFDAAASGGVVLNNLAVLFTRPATGNPWHHYRQLHAA